MMKPTHAYVLCLVMASQLAGPCAAQQIAKRTGAPAAMSAAERAVRQWAGLPARKRLVFVGSKRSRPIAGFAILSFEALSDGQTFTVRADTNEVISWRATSHNSQGNSCHAAAVSEHRLLVTKIARNALAFVKAHYPEFGRSGLKQMGVSQHGVWDERMLRNGVLDLNLQIYVSTDKHTGAVTAYTLYRDRPAYISTVARVSKVSAEATAVGVLLGNPGFNGGRRVGSACVAQNSGLIVTGDDIGLQRLEWPLLVWTSSRVGLTRVDFLRQLKSKNVVPPEERELSVDALTGEVASSNCGYELDDVLQAAEERSSRGNSLPTAFGKVVPFPRLQIVLRGSVWPGNPNDISGTYQGGPFAVTAKDQTKYTFNHQNGGTGSGYQYLTSIADTHGNTISLSYNNSDINKLTRVTDPYGRYLDFVWDGSVSRLDSVTVRNPNGSAVTINGITQTYSFKYAGDPGQPTGLATQLTEVDFPAPNGSGVYPKIQFTYGVSQVQVYCIKTITVYKDNGATPLVWTYNYDTNNYVTEVDGPNADEGQASGTSTPTKTLFNYTGTVTIGTTTYQNREVRDALYDSAYPNRHREVHLYSNLTSLNGFFQKFGQVILRTVGSQSTDDTTGSTYDTGMSTQYPGCYYAEYAWNDDSVASEYDATLKSFTDQDGYTWSYKWHDGTSTTTASTSGRSPTRWARRPPTRTTRRTV